MTTPCDPPPYFVASTGFPSGYFLIRNLGTSKLLDIEQDGRHDGVEAILWPETESSHVLSLRNPASDNQVFFVDYMGRLCSKASGHGIDVENDGRLVLRHRRPVIVPFPNRLSHPLPQFYYSARDGQILVSFSYDAAHPGQNQNWAASWRNRTYLLTSIPSRKPRGLLDDASEFLQGAATTISSPFAAVLGMGGGMDGSASASAAEVQRGDFDLREEELSEVDRVEEDSIDDDPDPLRRARVISLTIGAAENPGPRTRERRRWEIIPLLKAKAMTGTI